MDFFVQKVSKLLIYIIRFSIELDCELFYKLVFSFVCLENGRILPKVDLFIHLYLTSTEV